MDNVIVFSNQKGGVGKSTLSFLYAHWLADRQRQRVCVIDLDTQRNCSKSLRTFQSGIEAAALYSTEGVRLPSSPGGQGICLLEGSKALADVELARPEAVIPTFRDQVARLAQHFDAIVVDTPPALGLRMSAALIAATAVACPIELEEYSIDGVTDMLKTIFGVRRRYNPRLRMAGIVPNRFNPHSLRQKAALHDLVKNYASFVLPIRISTRSAIPEALAAGIPVWQLPKSSARDASLEVHRAFELLQARIQGVSQALAVENAA